MMASSKRWKGPRENMMSPWTGSRNTRGRRGGGAGGGGPMDDGGGAEIGMTPGVERGPHQPNAILARRGASFVARG